MIDNIKKYKNSPNGDYNFSVLLPTWNNIDYLKLCIESIRKNSSLNIQIIVFVNEGKNGTIEWLNGQSDLDYIISEENIGICYALNICRTLALSEYLIYLNDDMYVLPDWDLELQREIENLSTKLFMLSATMIEPHDTNNPSVIVKDYGDTIATFKEELLLKEYKSLKKENWSGSTWPPNVVHRDMWDLVGGLSIEFSPGMYSDPDFSKKLYDSGVRIFKGVGNSKVYHFGSKSTKKVKKNKGRDQFLKKWGMTSNSFNSKILNSGSSYKTLTDKELGKKDEILSKVKAILAQLRN